MRFPRRASAAVAFLLVACAGGGADLTVPASAFDAPSTAERLDRDGIVGTAVDPAVMAALLDDVGFEDGMARVWTDPRSTGIRRVEARAMRFSDVEGAAAYAAWVRENPADLLGEARQVATDPFVVFAHEPRGCCANKDASQYLATWTEGEIVWTVTVLGPDASEEAATAIASAIEEGDHGA
jgi:hypothetical protein